MLHGVGVSNGIGWNSDNTIMYFADSPTHCIYAFDFDASEGTLANRRVFAQNSGEVGIPDGLTVDSAGYVWCAYWDGAKIIRYAPAGSVARVIEVPALRPSSCVFGGENLTDLYITSAAEDDPQRQQYPFSGDLLRLKTDSKGQVKYKFAG